MRQFLLMTRRGTKPPSYVHYNIHSAIAEATRLSESLQDDVSILEIVGTVKQVEIPARIETKVTLKDDVIDEDDDLPF